MSMVIVKLAGGLGNQMFQYATGLRLARARGVACKLDLSFLRSPQVGCTARSYELDQYRISAGIADAGACGRFLKRSVARRLWAKLAGRRYHPPGYLKERHFHFDPDILEAPGDVYLDGYWQSEKYFQDIRGLLLEELSPGQPLTGRNRTMADQIISCQAVSIHVRRGDYVSSPLHGTPPLAYYQHCVAEIVREVEAPKLFAFSDDPAWAREHLRFSAPLHVIDHNGPEAPHEDLRLMSLCRHHVIANSSFSWWGAWLSRHDGKKVFAPKRWFADPTIDTSDLIPADWRRV